MLAIVKSISLTSTLQIEALHTPDGKNGAGLRNLCNLLAVELASQLLRIKRHPDLKAALHYVTVDTAAGSRSVAMLESWAIAAWAAGLQTSRLSPEKQEAALLLKQHAYAAIAKAFSSSEVPNQTPQYTQNPVQQPITASRSPNPFDRIIADMEDMVEGFHELKDDHAALEHRVIILEYANLGRRPTPSASMTPQMIGEIFLQLRLLRETIGIPIEEAEKMVAAEFGVAHLTDVDGSQWEALLTKVHTLFKQP
ncbi:MAG TPA: hypothetical protein VFU32_01855 [Ktedonobacterales bacterium]|nr:hypothetical protein [Ktedonobacterales bacterium]